MFTNFKNIVSEKEHGFTLIELIVVIIIVGILAAVGISQYSRIVERSRTAEAKVRIGTMRQLAYEYYLRNGSLVDLTNADLGVDNTCTPTDFYRYGVGFNFPGGYTDFVASRCVGGGKSPQGVAWTWSAYTYVLRCHSPTWRCYWYCFTWSRAGCFGLPDCGSGCGDPGCPCS